MNNVKNLFTPPSPLQEAVDKATSEYLIAPDWAQNLSICDVVNSSSSNAPVVVEALSNRINTSKNVQVIGLAITLAETLVKNCGTPLHRAIATKSFMDTITNVALGKRGGGEAQGKALELIQSWGQSFENMKSTVPLFNETYVSLKVRGINFPSASGPAPPIFTPARSVEVEGDRLDAVETRRDPFDKLRNNVDEVKRKITLLESLLAARSRGDLRQDDDSLLDTVDFLEQCKLRLLVLIEAGVTGALPEDLLEAVFQLNDDIERVLGRYKKTSDSSNLLDFGNKGTEDEFTKLASRRNSNPKAGGDPFAAIVPSGTSPLKSQRAPEADFFSAMGVPTAAPASVPANRLSGNPFDNAYPVSSAPSLPPPAAAAPKSKKYDDEFDEFLN